MELRARIELAYAALQAAA